MSSTSNSLSVTANQVLSLLAKLCRDTAEDNQIMVQYCIEIAKKQGLVKELNINKKEDYIFRSAVYSNNLKIVSYLLSLEGPLKVNTRTMNDSAFLNACWCNYDDMIRLIMKHNPYVYEYSFETQLYHINSPREIKNKKWETKRTMMFLRFKEQYPSNIIYELPDELSKIVIEYLYP
jgi:hypothetical protein